MGQAPDIRQLQERIALYEDMKAYRDLYELMFPGLHRFALAMVRSHEPAEEIVSDVFIKVWQLRSRLMEIQNLRVYLFTVTKNFSLNYITQNSRQAVMHIDLLDFDLQMDLRGPAELCISADLLYHIRKSIQELPPRCRTIFQLVKEDGMKYREVAEILNLSVLTVRNQLALAVRKLGEAIPTYLYTDLAKFHTTPDSAN